MDQAITLVRAQLDDVPFLMATERLPGYADLVGRWQEDRYRDALANHSYAILIGSSGVDRVGFAIVRDWCSAERVTHIKRLAIVQPGLGIGRKLLSAVVKLVFEETAAHRLWLGVFPENERAKRAYQAVGFVPEGVARGSAYFGDGYRDELIMAILRPDWLAAGSHHS